MSASWLENEAKKLGPLDWKALTFFFYQTSSYNKF